MRVLNLTTNENSPPFECQVRALEERGIACTNVSIPGTSGLETSRSMMDYLRSYPVVLKRSFGPYDLVHANYGLTAPIALAQPRLPVVLSLWGTDLEGYVGWMSRVSAATCDATIVMSEEMNRRLDQECFVIPHGVDLEWFEPMPRSEALAEVGWSDEVNNVLFPYRPDREVKNYPRAERVVVAAAERIPEPVTIRTLGDVPHSEMPTYMNAADCLLLTSHREGSPNVVKEAMACNLPVVSVDVGDVRKQLAGVEPSAICGSDRELVSALVSILRRGERSNGREHADSISSQRMAEQLHEVYRGVVADSA